MSKRLALASLVTLVALACQDAIDPTSLGLADGTSPPGPGQSDGQGGPPGAFTSADDGPLRGTGTAAVDGMIGAGEWDDAGRIDIFAGEYAGSQFWVMNDADNLYIAVAVIDDTPGDDDQAVVRFDNDNNDVTDEGDDRLTVGLSLFQDGHFSSGSWGPLDTQQDGAGAATSDGAVTFHEMSHPLNSGDAEDFALALGDVVGFCVRYFDDDTAISDSHYPTDCQLEVNEQTLYAEIMIVAPPATILVDIKPGDDVSPINLKSQGVIPVAIMGSDVFDVNEIDRTTLRFGPGGAMPAHKDLGHLADLNGDGIDDLMTHYRTQEAGLSVGDTEACVTGATLGGESFEGCDAVWVKN